MNFILILLFCLHPFHVSVTSLEHDQERQALEISMSIFADDLEKAIMEAGGPELNVGTAKEHHKANSYISEYLEDKFLISVNGNPVKWQYLGFEYENGAVWNYLEIKNVPELTNLEVKNGVLMELFRDQENIIHTKVGDKKKSDILKRGDIHSRFAY